MTIGSNTKTGERIITLNADESRHFESGFPIIKTTAMRSGVMEMTVQNRIVCPNGVTKSFLRNLIHETQSKAGQADQLCTLTVENAWGLLRPDDQKAISDDLKKFANLVGKDIPIVEIAYG